MHLQGHQELQHCSELGRISVTADCGVVSVMCRSEALPKEIGAIDFLKETWLKTERMGHDLVKFSYGSCLLGMIFGKPRRTQCMFENNAFFKNGLFDAHGKLLCLFSFFPLCRAVKRSCNRCLFIAFFPEGPALLICPQFVSRDEMIQQFSSRCTEVPLQGIQIHICFLVRMYQPCHDHYQKSPHQTGHSDFS